MTLESQIWDIRNRLLVRLRQIAYNHVKADLDFDDACSQAEAEFSIALDEITSCMQENTNLYSGNIEILEEEFATKLNEFKESLKTAKSTRKR